MFEQLRLRYTNPSEVTRDYVLAREDATEDEIPYDRLREADDILVTSAIRGLQRATLPGRHQLPDSSDVRNDQRHSRHGRLQHGHRHPLATTAHDEDVRGGEEAPNV